MNEARQPIYLFSDSQLLFWREETRLFLDSVRALISSKSPRAAYVGASNGDDPRFYSIFEAAMESITISERRMIHSAFSDADRRFVVDADLVLLAGGDIERGWRVINDTGLGELLIRKYAEGAVLMGISAGAAQLGLFALREGAESAAGLIEMLKLVPFIVGSHEEHEDWTSLRSTIEACDGKAIGIGIPSGGGMAYHPDGSVQALRRTLHEFTSVNGRIRERLLIPPAEGADLSGRSH